LIVIVAVLGNTAGQFSDEVLVAANAFVVELFAALEVVAKTVLLSLS
jgi:hypothetical protein